MVNHIFNTNTFVLTYDYAAKSDRTKINATIIQPFEQILTVFGKFRDLIEKYIDVDKLAQNEFKIRHEISPELTKIEAQIENQEIKIRRIAKSVEHEIGFSVSIEKDGNGCYLLRVPKKAERNIISNSAMSQYKVSSIRANNMMLTSKELSSISHDKQVLVNEYMIEQTTMVEKILKIVSSYHPAVEDWSEYFGELDVLWSFALFSGKQFNKPMVRPNFNSGNRVVFKSWRHPIVDRFGEYSATPNDWMMEAGKSSFHVITGPNMGGKSTFIRQVAINIFLAQIGWFWWADYAETPVFESIITRVGAGDVQAKGLSTWMSELLEVSWMLECSSSKTFMVIDELGRGTSTSEGIGMTWAISDYIITKLN